MLQPEFALLKVVSDFYEDLRTNPNSDWKIDVIFQGLDSSERAKIRTHLAGDQQWFIDLAFRRDIDAGPIVSLMITDDVPREGEGPYVGDGLEPTIINNADESFREYRESYKEERRGTFSLLCLSPSMVLTSWMYYITKYALFEARQPGSDTTKTGLHNYGINEVVIRGGDFSPDERYFPDWAFVRVVSVSCQWTDFWETRTSTTTAVKTWQVGNMTIKNSTTGQTITTEPYPN